MRERVGASVLGSGGVVAFVSALLPWLSASAPNGLKATSVGVGTDDGKLVLFLAIAVILVAVAAVAGRLSQLTAALVAVLPAGIIVIISSSDLSTARRNVPAGLRVSLGPGLYAALAGGIIAILGAGTAIVLARTKAAPPEQAAPPDESS